MTRDKTPLRRIAYAQQFGLDAIFAAIAVLSVLVAIANYWADGPRLVRVAVPYFSIAAAVGLVASRVARFLEMIAKAWYARLAKDCGRAEEAEPGSPMQR